MMIKVPTVMENPGKNCCHGKSWKKSWNMKISQKVMEKSWNCFFSWLWQLSSLWLSCMLWDAIINISETLWEWESWKKANQSWKSRGILFSDFCGNPDDFWDGWWTACTTIFLINQVNFKNNCISIPYTRKHPKQLSESHTQLQHVKRARLRCKVRSCTIHPTCGASVTFV